MVILTMHPVLPFSKLFLYLLSSGLILPLIYHSFFFFNLFCFYFSEFYLFLFLFEPGLHCCANFCLIVVSRGHSCSAWASYRGGLFHCRGRVLGCRDLGSCGLTGLVAQQMWNLPGLGIELMSPALAGRFLSTVPSGKSKICLCYIGL